MTLTARRLLTLAAVVAVILGGTSAGLALAATRTIPPPLRVRPMAHRLAALAQPGRVAVAPRALSGGELPRDWQDHGTWWPAIGQLGTQTAQVALHLGPVAGWLPCQYGPTGVSVVGRRMTYRCAARPGSAAGAITLVAPLVQTATGWWEHAATDSQADRATFAVFRRARLTRASNGRPWWVTPNRVLVRIEPPPETPTLGLRPGSQRVPAGHPAGLTVTGAHWPAGAYAVLWDMTDNVDTTPTPGSWCATPDCQWMVPASPPGTYEFAVYLHARSGARIASLPSTVTVTWVASKPAPAPPPAATPTPLPTPVATPTVTPTPPPPSSTFAYSPNWSGYVVGNGPYTGATGTFDVPNLYASSTQAWTAEWVGIDGAASSDSSLIQTGVTEIYDPSTNLVNFQAWWEILPAPSTSINMALSPGNAMTATVDQVSAGIWALTLTNDTTGAAFTTEQSYTAPLSSAEWIVEAPTNGATHQIDPLGDYTPDVTFTNDRFNGVQATLQEEIMVQNGAQVSTPSDLSASGSFSVAYGSTAPPVP